MEKKEKEFAETTSPSGVNVFGNKNIKNDTDNVETPVPNKEVLAVEILVQSIPPIDELTVSDSGLVRKAKSAYDVLTFDQKYSLGEELQNKVNESYSKIIVLESTNSTEYPNLPLVRKTTNTSKRVTHQVISPSIDKGYLNSLDTIAENLDVSRNELLESLIYHYVDTVKRTKETEALLNKPKKRK